jgi:hypothetical protein
MSRTTTRTAVRGIVAATTLALLLGACSDSETPAPAGSSSAPSESASAAEGVGTDVCPDQNSITDAAEMETFATVGEVTAAQDEGAAVHGLTWRHYLPLTVTNPLDAACRINVVVSVTGSDDGYMDGGGTVVLEPGQTAELQIFDLDSEFAFDGDSEAAAPTETLAATVHQVSTAPVTHHYDADVEFGEITGEGAAAVLPVTVTKNGVLDDAPEGAGDDILFIEGLDASGSVVGRFVATPDGSLEVGGTATYDVPATLAGNGDGNGFAYQPLSATEDIVEYRVVLYRPSLLR